MSSRFLFDRLSFRCKRHKISYIFLFALFYSAILCLSSVALNDGYVSEAEYFAASLLSSRFLKDRGISDFNYIAPINDRYFFQRYLWASNFTNSLNGYYCGYLTFSEPPKGAAFSFDGQELPNMSDPQVYALINGEQKTNPLGIRLVAGNYDFSGFAYLPTGDARIEKPMCLINEALAKEILENSPARKGSFGTLVGKVLSLRVSDLKTLDFPISGVFQAPFLANCFNEEDSSPCVLLPAPPVLGSFGRETLTYKLTAENYYSNYSLFKAMEVHFPRPSTDSEAFCLFVPNNQWILDNLSRRSTKKGVAFFVPVSLVCLFLSLEWFCLRSNRLNVTAAFWSMAFGLPAGFLWMFILQNKELFFGVNLVTFSSVACTVILISTFMVLSLAIFQDFSRKRLHFKERIVPDRYSL